MVMALGLGYFAELWILLTFGPSGYIGHWPKGRLPIRLFLTKIVIREPGGVRLEFHRLLIERLKVRLLSVPSRGL